MGVAMWQFSISIPSLASLSMLGERPGRGLPVHPSESQFRSSAVINYTLGGLAFPVAQWMSKNVLRAIIAKCLIMMSVYLHVLCIVQKERV